MQAKEDTKKAQYKEEIEIIIMEKQIEKSQNPEETRPFIKIVAEAIEEKTWVNGVIICDEEGNQYPDVELKKCTKIIVETKDGYEIIVNVDNDSNTAQIVEPITKGKTEQWEVEFKANGGAGEEPEKKTIRKGFSFKLPKGENLNREGYKIVGWSEEKEATEGGENKIYACESLYKPNQKSTTLYAIWSEDTVEISFNNNTGEGEMQNVNAIAGREIQLPRSSFVKQGYSFKEWNTNNDGNGTSYVDGATISVNKNTILYAIWEEDITISLLVQNNKIVENTKMEIGATATTGVQNVELKVGNNKLYTEEYDGSITYSKNDLLVQNLDGTAFANLPFYDIGIEVSITSASGNTKTKTFECKNYTIGNSGALEKFAQVVDGGNSLSGETIYLLRDLNVQNHNPIGTYAGESGETVTKSKYFGGVFEGNGHKININYYSSKMAVGLFGAIYGAIVRNITVIDALPQAYAVRTE